MPLEAGGWCSNFLGHTDINNLPRPWQAATIVTRCLGQILTGAGNIWLGPGLAFQPDTEPGSLKLVSLEGFAEIGQTQLQKGKPV